MSVHAGVLGGFVHLLQLWCSKLSRFDARRLHSLVCSYSRACNLHGRSVERMSVSQAGISFYATVMWILENSPITCKTSK